jgi:hypothetical protein
MVARCEAYWLNTPFHMCKVQYALGHNPNNRWWAIASIWFLKNLICSSPHITHEEDILTERRVDALGLWSRCHGINSDSF